MIIDVHGHLVPPDLLAATRKEHGASPAAPDRGWRWLGDCLCRRQAIAADHAGLERPYRTSRVDGQAGDRSEADLEVRGGRANAAAPLS
jgi:hypothetical protein